MNFNELPIDSKLKNSIKFADFKTPTPIQSKSIPISLMGASEHGSRVAAHGVHYRHALEATLGRGGAGHRCRGI